MLHIFIIIKYFEVGTCLFYI